MRGKDGEKKANTKWINQGNSNIKYFHTLINWRRLENEIKGIEIQGEWCEESNKVEGKVGEHFEDELTRG